MSNNLFDNSYKKLALSSLNSHIAGYGGGVLAFFPKA
jgi:hypothetical protein